MAITAVSVTFACASALTIVLIYIAVVTICFDVAISIAVFIIITKQSVLQTQFFLRIYHGHLLPHVSRCISFGQSHSDLMLKHMNTKIGSFFAKHLTASCDTLIDI